MPDYLLIRARSAADTVDALAVAAEMTQTLGGEDTQVDVATAEAFADVAGLGRFVRRVVAVPPPNTEGFAAPSFSVGGFLSAAKKMADIAGKNLRGYKAVMEDLRLVRYAAVFDFDASSFSLMVAKAAKCDAIVGFDEKNLRNPPPGVALLYHHAHRLIDDDKPARGLLRALAARHLDYPLPPTAPKKILSKQAPPAEVKLPSSPFVVSGGELPAAFAEVIKNNGTAHIVLDENLPATAMSGIVQAAAMAIGNGVVTALGAAAGIKTLFVGGGRHLPEGALLADTPTALTQLLRDDAPKVSDTGASQPPPKLDDIL